MAVDKIGILFNGIEALKDDVETNHSEIAKILSLLIETNPIETINIWLYLIESNWDEVLSQSMEYGGICNYVTVDIFNSVSNRKEFETFDPYFLDSNKLIEYVFTKSGRLSSVYKTYVGILVRNHDYENAEIMFENNKTSFKKQRDATLFSGIVSAIQSNMSFPGVGVYFSNYDKNEEAFEFLSYWVDKLEDSVEIAKAQVYLVELI